MMQQQHPAQRSRSLMEWVILWFNYLLGIYLFGITRTMLNDLISTDSSLDKKLCILGFCLMTLSLLSTALFLFRRAYAIAQKLELLASISGMVSVGAFAYYCCQQHFAPPFFHVAVYGSLFLFACLLAWVARWLDQLAESER